MGDVHQSPESASQPGGRDALAGDDAAALLEATLRAAPQLQPTSLLRGVDVSSGVQQPASQLMLAAFSVAAGAGAGLLEATAAELPLMPRAGALDSVAAGRFEALGRLLLGVA